MKQRNADDAKAIKIAILVVLMALFLFAVMAVKSERNHGEKQGASKAQVDSGVHYQKW